MKTLRIFLTVLLVVFPFTTPAAPTAQVHFVCLSLRFQPGSGVGGSTLVLSSVSGTPNGELYPAGSGIYASGIILNIFGSPITGDLQVYLPAFLDANGNGFDDFFEVAQGVGLSTTTGDYSTGLSDGIITARWSRSAGAKNGTCSFNLEDNDFGDLGDFTHTFEVLEYTGPLTYTPGNSNVTASLNLTQTGNPAGTLQGPALFSKPDTNDFDHLLLHAGNWTNAAAQTLSYEEDALYRDTFLHTNYYGWVWFADGDPTTAGYDYPLWQLSIDDVNDADADTIPDFSDAPSAAASSRRPSLSLARGAANLWLTISGDVGRLHHVLERTNLAGGNWQTNLSLTLTNDPQTIPLPLPSQAVKYWRVQVP
jgi:hypothetical protein